MAMEDSGEGFEKLIQKLSSAHLNEVASLHRKVDKLQRQLEETRDRVVTDSKDRNEDSFARLVSPAIVEEATVTPPVLSREIRVELQPPKAARGSGQSPAGSGQSPAASPYAEIEMFELSPEMQESLVENSEDATRGDAKSLLSYNHTESEGRSSIGHIGSSALSPRKSKLVFTARNVSSKELYNDQASATVKYCTSVLNNPKFEAALCLVIFLNAVVFALEAQNKGMGYGHAGFGGDLPDYFWPNGDPAFRFLEMLFGVIFTIEVVLRLLVRRHHFFCGAWNWLDLIIVLVWIFGQIFEDLLPVNSQVLRLARLIRLFRLLRLVRRIQQFDSLYLMSTAIRSSFGILGWTAALLFLIQMLFALVLNQLLYGFYFAETASMNEGLKDRQEIVYTYFGTFSRSLLTMFEITLANWPPVCRVLTENVTEWFMIFFLIHKVTMGFAVIGVINGVLMQETFKVASYDDTIMMRTKQKAMENHIRKMQLLFDEADTSEDGKIDLQEFQEIVADTELKAWLGAMELDIRDVGEAWELLQDNVDDHGGQLTAEQLVLGVAKLQGTAKSLDLMKVIREQQSMMRKIGRLQTGFRKLHEHICPDGDLVEGELSQTEQYVSV